MEVCIERDVLAGCIALHGYVDSFLPPSLTPPLPPPHSLPPSLAHLRHIDGVEDCDSELLQCLLETRIRPPPPRTVHTPLRQQLEG